MRRFSLPKSPLWPPAVAIVGANLVFARFVLTKRNGHASRSPISNTCY